MQNLFELERCIKVLLRLLLHTSWASIWAYLPNYLNPGIQSYNPDVADTEWALISKQRPLPPWVSKNRPEVRWHRIHCVCASGFEWMQSDLSKRFSGFICCSRTQCLCSYCQYSIVSANHKFCVSKNRGLFLVLFYQVLRFCRSIWWVT